jgi:hypothetical protein
LECHEAAGKTESWYGMPKMKGLKDLMLPVGNENETGGYGCAWRAQKS